MGQIELTHEQEKVIQLIKTWDVQNVKLALLMDDTQGLGVQELYTGFITQWGYLFHDKTLVQKIQLSQCILFCLIILGAGLMLMFQLRLKTKTN